MAGVGTGSREGVGLSIDRHPECASQKSRLSQGAGRLSQVFTGVDELLIQIFGHLSPWSTSNST